MTLELSRPVTLTKIGTTGLPVSVRATPEECESVARRMDIPAIRSLECHFHLARDPNGAAVTASGRLRAKVIRVCVLSGEEFKTTVAENFEVRFVPAGEEREDPDPDLVDEIPIENDTIDLGEATTEQLGLALDPYPKMPGATVPEHGESHDTSPFAILARKARPEK